MKRESATWRLTRVLGTEIVSGIHRPGDPFPIEHALSQTHDLSRSVVREAIKILAAKRLIVSRPKIGIRVRPRADWNMFDPDVLEWIGGMELDDVFLLELLQMRCAVEPEAAALAALTPDSPGVAALGTAFDRMVAASNGLDDPLESDVAFHRALLDASGNRMFAQLGNLVSAVLRAGIRYTNRVAGRRIGRLDDHEKLLIAIRSGNSDLARHASRTMLEETSALVQAGRASERRG
jgi:DNA-binding FadR family transcriptional regulator